MYALYQTVVVYVDIENQNVVILVVWLMTFFFILNICCYLFSFTRNLIAILNAKRMSKYNQLLLFSNYIIKNNYNIIK